ncbi:MAG: AarF/UbiB family protein [bacterium]
MGSELGVENILEREPDHRDTPITEPLEKLRRVLDTVTKAENIHKKALEANQKKEKEADARLHSLREKSTVEQLEHFVGFEKDPEFLAKIDEITQKLAKAAGFTRKVKTISVSGDTINAFVYVDKSPGSNEDAPGVYTGSQNEGHIVFLYTGLVTKLAEHLAKQGKKLNEGHIAGVLAHEMRHLIQQKEKRSEKVTRKQEEYDADLGGVELMGRAGYSPRDVVETMDFLKELSKRMPYSKSHPAAASRIVEISGRISNPDLPVPGIEIPSVELTALPKTQTYEGRFDESFEASKPGGEVTDFVRNLLSNSESMFDLHVKRSIASSAIDLAFAKEFVNRPEIPGFFMQYLLLEGRAAEQEIQNEETVIKNIEDDVLGLEAKKMSGGISNEEEYKLNEWKESIRFHQKSLARAKLGGDSRLQLTYNLTHESRLKAWGGELPRLDSEASLRMQSNTEEKINREKFLVENGSLAGGREEAHLEVKANQNVNWDEAASEWLAGKGFSGVHKDTLELGYKRIQASFKNAQSNKDELVKGFAFELDRMNRLEGLAKEQESRRLSAVVADDFRNKFQEILDADLPKDIPDSERAQIYELFAGAFDPIQLSEPGAKAVLEFLKKEIFDNNSIDVGGKAGTLTSQKPARFNLYYVVRAVVESGVSLDAEYLNKTISELKIKCPAEISAFERLEKLNRETRLLSEEGTAAGYYLDTGSKLPSAERDILRKKIVSNLSRSHRDVFGFLILAYGLYLPKDGFLDKESSALFLIKLIKDGYDDHVMTGVLGKLQEKSPSDRETRLRIGSLYDRLKNPRRNTYDASGSELDSLLEFIKAEGIPLPEALAEVYRHNLEGSDVFLEYKKLWQNGDLKGADLRKYYELIRGIERRTNDFGYEPHAHGILAFISAEHFEKTDPVFAAKIVDDQMGEYKYSEKIYEEKLSFEQIIADFPKGKLRNGLLHDCWKRNGASISDFEKLSPFFTEEPESYGMKGENNLGAGFVIIFGNNIEEGSFGGSTEAQNSYRAREQSGEMVDYNSGHWYADIDRLGCLESIYAKQPEYLLDTKKTYLENKKRILELCPKSQFRDYLLMKALGLEVQGKRGLSREFSISPLADRLNNPALIGATENSVNFIDTWKFPEMTPAISKYTKFTEKAREIFSELRSDDAKDLLTRMVLDNAPKDLPELELLRITEFYPEPCVARDDYLKKFMLRNSLSIEKIQELRKLFTTEALRGGEVPQMKMLGLEVARTEGRRLKNKKRSDYVNWILGVDKYPPTEMMNAGGAFGFSFESIRNGFAGLTETERERSFDELLLHDEGMLDPKTPEDHEAMDNFLRKVYREKFSAKKNTEAEAENDIFEKVFMTVFQNFIPERRAKLFSALYSAMKDKKGERMEFEELAGTFLEQIGAVGIKLGQILSSNDNLPFSRENKPMPKKLKDRLKRLKDGVRPFSVIGSAQRLVDFGLDKQVKTIDGLLAAASIKQAHSVTLANGERAVLKVRRPVIDDVRNDFEVLGAVFKVLNENGYQVPKYLLSELETIIADEADFTKEASNQQLLSENMPERVGGMKAKTPEISATARGVMLERFASSTPYEKFKNKNPEEAGRISGDLGLEILRGLTKTGVLHADLHDGNIFVDGAGKEMTLIDAGAVADIRKVQKSVLRIYKGLSMKNSRMVAKSIIALSEKSDLDAEALAGSLEAIVNSGEGVDKKATKLSFEILNSVNPGPELRYFLKALATGGHHIDKIDATKPKNAWELAKAGVRIMAS